MKNTIISFCKDTKVRMNVAIINFFVLIIVSMLAWVRIIPIETFAICIFFTYSVRSAIESIACTDEKILQKNSLVCVLLANYQFTLYVLLFIFAFIFYSINYYNVEVNLVGAFIILFTCFVIIPILPFALSKLCKKILKK